jgi:microcystin-dependent protein
MSTPYIGEIRAFGFTFQPSGWLLCNGQSLSISQFDVLFNLIGTTYGGNGTTTFNLPNLQGRVPMHQGTSSQMTTVLGQAQGTETVTVTTATMPAHNHTITMGQVPSGGVVDRQAAPSSTTYLSNSNNDGVYNRSSPTLNATLSNNTIGLAGGSQPHENMQPYQVISFCIAYTGIYPSQS